MVSPLEATWSPVRHDLAISFKNKEWKRCHQCLISRHSTSYCMLQALMQLRELCPSLQQIITNMFITLHKKTDSHSKTNIMTLILAQPGWYNHIFKHPCKFVTTTATRILSNHRIHILIYLSFYRESLNHPFCHKPNTWC